MSVKEQRLIDEMSKPGVKSKRDAAIKAGYAASTASVDAYKILEKPRIQEAIERNKQFVLSSANVTKENSLGRLAMFAFADLDMLVDVDESELAKRAGVVVQEIDEVQ